MYVNLRTKVAFPEHFTVIFSHESLFSFADADVFVPVHLSRLLTLIPFMFDLKHEENQSATIIQTPGELQIVTIILCFELFPNNTTF